MELNRNEILQILNSNTFDNLICRTLESRPGELAKYICALANTNGGYIFIGIEKDNGVFKRVGFQDKFDMDNIMIAARKKLLGDLKTTYGYIYVLGVNIFVIKVEKAKQRILVDDIYYCYKNNGVEVMVQEKLNKPSTLFISYKECDAPIADIIEEKICNKLNDEIKISRYTQLKYKDSFKEFMDKIEDHDFVLTIVSDSYLKSQACMYEVSEILKSHHYKDKLLFVVLNENDRKYYGEDAPKKVGAGIYGGISERLEYTKYWQNKYYELKGQMDEIKDYEAKSEATKELKIIGQIYKNSIGEFMDFLCDENGKSFQNLYDNEFDDIVEWIKFLNN